MRDFHYQESARSYRCGAGVCVGAESVIVTAANLGKGNYGAIYTILDHTRKGVG